MRIVNIKRTHRLPSGTYGILDFENEPFCVTLELPWKNNSRDISCIPAGEFLANRIISPKRHIDVYELFGVPNRDNIEIHPGNSIYDIQGCVLLGRAFGIVETKDNGEILGVQDSRDAFNRFMAKLNNDDQIKLVITDV